jgi:subtilase family serine protease
MFLRVVIATLSLSAAAMAAGSRPVCPGPAAFGTARCHSHVTTDKKGNPNVSTAPSAYGPVQFQTAYSLPSGTAGSGQTVAIVDAYDDPNIESDLAVYSSMYGLLPCTTANGCFKKVNQTGGTSYPRKDAGWSLEISLDVEIAHAVCPNCKILLVEAASNSFANLIAAEDYAPNRFVIVSRSSH